MRFIGAGVRKGNGESVFVIIPAFNEAEVIAGVVSGLRDDYRVVVIDDGSADDTAGRAAAAGAIVLRHLMNRGQGAALQTGLDYCRAAGARYLVTFDSDGQHSPEDIPALLAPLLDGSADVVLGSRFLGTGGNVPLTRRLLLRAGVLFTRVMSGVRVTDTHNGMRAFTRDAASRIRLRLDRMAHASELLDQIRRGGLRYVEVPVHIVYTTYSRAKGQRASGALRIVFDYVVGRWLR